MFNISTGSDKPPGDDTEGSPFTSTGQTSYKYNILDKKIYMYLKIKNTNICNQGTDHSAL